MTCSQCPLKDTPCRHPRILGTGPVPAPLFLIGEAPGANEDHFGQPFVGQAGKLLDFVLAKLSLDRDDIYVTNVVKCRPPENKMPTGETGQNIIDCCWPYLETELQEVDPKVVVLMGNTALKLIGETGIRKLEGVEVETIYEGVKTFACFHPAFVLRSPSAECNLGRALWRAAKAAGMRPKPIGEEVGLFPYEVRGM